MTSYRERALARVKALVLEDLARWDVAVYLFGSSATGAIRPGSDVDVAVEPRAPLPPRVLADLRETLEESTIPYEIDVVDLSQASPQFRERVRREGVVWRD
jgi:predicted nucleotidyltransferase